MPQKITLRKKLVGSGQSLSLFLDYSPPAPHSKTGKIVRKEYLGLYIYPPLKVSQRKGRAAREIFDTNPIFNQEKAAHNSEQLAIAKAILARRLNELNKPEIYNRQEQQVLEIEKRGKQSFVAFFEKYCEQRLLKGQRIYSAALVWYKRYTKGEQVSFSEITPEHCEGFKTFLLRASNEGTISYSTAQQYFNFLRFAINAAERLDYVVRNPNKKVDVLKRAVKEKEFLTIEEAELLAKTDCKLPELKRAALFAFLTGLRRSDILGLTWEKVVKHNEKDYSLKIVIKKSNKPTLKPISPQAAKLLGEPKQPKEKVFKLTDSQIDRVLPTWIKAAGITKKITMHNFRHSFISNLLLQGAGITEASRLADHNTVTQTLNTYSHLTAQRLRDTVELLTLKLD